jgi:hypothetical protein
VRPEAAKEGPKESTSAQMQVAQKSPLPEAAGAREGGWVGPGPGAVAGEGCEWGGSERPRREARCACGLRAQPGPHIWI